MGNVVFPYTYVSLDQLKCFQIVSWDTQRDPNLKGKNYTNLFANMAISVFFHIITYLSDQRQMWRLENLFS